MTKGQRIGHVSMVGPQLLRQAAAQELQRRPGLQQRRPGLQGSCFREPVAPNLIVREVNDSALMLPQPCSETQPAG